MYRSLKSFNRSQISFLAALLAGMPFTSQAASYTFADGIRLINGSSDYHEYDSATGEPVHIYLPGTTLGDGSVLEASSSVTGGTADDGTILPSMTLQAYSSLGDITTTDQIMMRSQAKMTAEFEVTAPGAQSISIAWDGTLHATGDAYAWYSLKVGFNQYNGVYDLLNTYEDTFFESTVDITDAATFTFDFASEDVGSIQNLQVFLTTYAELPYGGGSTSGAYADLSNTFRVTGWSSGLSSLDGAMPAVPVPAAIWLFGSGLLGLVAVARRGRATDR